MKRNQLFGFVLAGFLMISASPAFASLITSFYDPALGNWTVSNGNPGNPGSYVISSYDTMQISASANPVTSDIILTATVSQNSTMILNWTLNNNGNNGGAPVADIFVMQGATVIASYNLVGTSGSIYGINLPSGSTISFELDSLNGTLNGKTPATLGLEIVPEAGTWLAAAFLGGFVTLSLCRRKSPKSPSLTP